MDATTKIQRLQMALKTLQADPATPWYLVEMVYQLIDLVSEHDDLVDHVSLMCHYQDEQKASIQGLRDQYSEVLYKLKSGE